MRDMNIEEAKKVKHVVFVDSQWHSAHRILRDERLAKVKCVKITKQKTRFWRYQMCGEECLATIEGKTINHLKPKISRTRNY
jgi:DTW domain-containing protein YfiP